MPHGYCLEWNPALVWLFVIGNSLVTLSYYSIPASLSILVSKKNGLVFHWMFILFGAFIFACGTTHLVKIWTIWHPDYWMEASLDLVTGVLSMVTAVLLWPLVPRALALPSPAQLEAEIVQRKKAEEKFRGLLEAAPDAIVIVDKDGEIHLVNAQTEKMFGHLRENLLGKRVDMLLPDSQREERRAEWASMAGEQLSSGLATYESVGVRADGTEFPVEISLSPLQSEEGVFVSTAIRDITLRKVAEANLRDSEERFRLLVAGVRDYAITMLDADGNVVSWNSGAEHIEGFTPQEIIGQNFSRFHLPEERESNKPAEELAIAAREGKYEVEGWRVRKDDSKFFASVLLTSINDENGKLRGFANITRDITERKKAQESEQDLTQRLTRSNKELQQFAYVVAHDLREPLRSISTFADLLAQSCRTKLDTRETEFLEIVLSANERMQQLITDLLAYCRVERTAATPTPVDTGKLVQQVLTNLYVAVEESHGRVEIGELPEIVGDQVQLRQLFQNLIGNALKYRGPEDPVVLVSGEQKNGDWQFAVSDNGIGFDMNFADRIFQPFHRLHAGSKYSGTGIGLAICRKIVEHHGGKIWAQSQQGPHAGSTFYFTIPTQAIDKS
ncbi:MAG: PAS domain S-box protein [Cyanobacteria bacterium SZAS-4]|nr:PAS domain S-box protein [Cyanobacteria bacterium SZAS-4]